jgi:type IV pilus assembly protein PilC
MAAFVWEGRTRAGELKKGVMEASAEPDVTAKLRQQNISVTKIKKQSKQLQLPEFGSGVPSKDLVVFTRQMATMIDAGLPIVQCLDLLGGQQPNKRFQKILTGIKTDLESGAHFSEALKKYPKVFNDLYVNLVAAGEAGGILDRILARLATYIEKAEKLKGTVKGALIYPIAVICIAIVVVIMLLWKVIPVFQNMFKDFGNGALPAPTQVVIAISEGFQAHAILIVGSLVGFVVGINLFITNKKGKAIFDRLALRSPLFGPLLRKVAVARFTRTLGTLLASGVPILDALEIVARTAGNTVVMNAILYARQKISEGRTMTEPLLETKVFPTMVVQMIGVGEQTGAMDNMLQKIADFYEEEVDVAVAALTKLMEPLMMVFLGGIVGGLLIAMYMPIFELAGNIKGE